jgi:hypothetical protein
MADAKQTTKRQPGPYPHGGEAIWDEFLRQSFGDEESGAPGYLDLQEDQQDWLNQQFDDYSSKVQGPTQGFVNTLQGQQEEIMTAKPTIFSFGGEPFAKYIPKGPERRARTMANLGAKEYTTQMALPAQELSWAQKYTPQGPQLDYLNLLSQIAMPMQELRYGIPTSRTDTDYERSAAGQAGDWVDLLSSGYGLADSLWSGGSDDKGTLASDAWNWLTK